MMAEMVAKNPFHGMKISSHEPLRIIEERCICHRCQKSRKYYCYSCCELVGLDPAEIPQLHLPTKIYVVKHKQELVGKSSAIPAKILAPDDIHISEFPDIPQFRDTSKVVLIYPAKNAMTCEDFVASLKRKHSPPEAPNDFDWWTLLDAIVFIDCTWQQTYQMLQHDQLKCLQTIVLTDVETTYWRPSKKDTTHLATVEAIYFVLRKLDQLFSTKTKYQGIVSRSSSTKFIELLRLLLKYYPANLNSLVIFTNSN